MQDTQAIVPGDTDIMCTFVRNVSNPTMVAQELSNGGSFVSREGSREIGGSGVGERLTFPCTAFCNAFENLLCVYTCTINRCMCQEKIKHRNNSGA